MTPRFSLIIPTRARPATFRHSFAAALACGSPGVEILVQNNGADPETRAIVARAADPRVAYAETAEVLAMTDNWELALSRAGGDWVMVIGDDDAVMPGWIDHAAAVIAAAPDHHLLSWAAVDFGWPDASPRLRDRLTVPLAADRRGWGWAYDSAPTLAGVYAGQLMFLTLPSIYHGLTHRSVIDAVRQRRGRYFDTALPDVYAGVANLAVRPAFLRLNRPLSVRGESGFSIGAAYADHAGGGRRRAQFEQANGTAYSVWHPALIPAASAQMVIANSLLHARDHWFAGGGPELSIAGWLQLMINYLPFDDPSGHALRLAEIQLLALRHGIAFDPATMPPIPDRRSPQAPGRHDLGDGTWLEVVDCARAGIRTVDQAARLAATLAG